MQTKKKQAGGEIGFRCMGTGCGRWIGDRRYVGPVGHAPQNLCFECWMVYWGRVEARAVNGGRWTDLDEALWLVCCGASLSDAAEVIAAHRTTLWRWIEKMRFDPELRPDWLANLEEIRRTCRDQ